MLSSSDSCRQLVAGNYDVILDDDELATFKSVLSDFLTRFEHHENELLSIQQQQQQLHLQQQQQQQQSLELQQPLQQPPGQPLMAGSYVNEFKMLKELSKALKENTENFIDGLEYYNQSKNRYKDIIPFNHTRVILNCIPQLEPGSNYINANYVRGPSGSQRSYIACQGPLPHTLNDFWRMIWECRVSVIVMACNEQEMGRAKCEQYWPNQVNGSLIYGNIQVTLMRVRQINSDFLIRKFSVQLLEPQETSDPLKQQQQQTVRESPLDQNDTVQLTNNYSHHHHQQTNNNNNHDKNNNVMMTNATTTNPGSVNGGQHFHRHNSHDNCGFSNSGNSSTSNESINTSDDSSMANHHHHHKISSHIQNHQRLNQNQIPNLNQNQQAQDQHQNTKPNLASATRSNRAVLMERTVCQFHFQGWQDHGVPDSVQSILELVRLIREVQPGYSSSILVHCSAGCGRTGTICCIDYVYGLMRMGRLRRDFDLFTIISEMRQQRMAMVQTIEQYILCHRAVAALFMQQLHILGFGINQNRCLAIDKTAGDNSTGGGGPAGGEEADNKSNQYDTSSSTVVTDEQSSNSKCSFEQFEDDEDDEGQDLGPVFI